MTKTAIPVALGAILHPARLPGHIYQARQVRFPDEARPRFEPGWVFVTYGAAVVVEPIDPEASPDVAQLYALLGRHCFDDWGDLDAHDRGVNATAARARSGRVLSTYQLNGKTLWAMTSFFPTGAETTILTPEKY